MPKPNFDEWPELKRALQQQETDALSRNQISQEILKLRMEMFTNSYDMSNSGKAMNAAISHNIHARQEVYWEPPYDHSEIKTKSNLMTWLTAGYLLGPSDIRYGIYKAALFVRRAAKKGG